MVPRMGMRKTTKRTPLDALRELIAKRGNKTAVAAELGIPRPHLYEILNEERGVSESLARSLGFEKRVTFDPISR
jgi:plasmid maintenance system antidote protein VapI